MAHETVECRCLELRYLGRERVAHRLAEKALEVLDDEETDVDAVRAHLARYRAKAKSLLHPLGHETAPGATMPTNDAAGSPTEAPTASAQRTRRMRFLDAGLRDLGV